MHPNDGSEATSATVAERFGLDDDVPESAELIDNSA